MRVRLVHVTTRRSGRAEREEALERETLGVGRGTDNAVSLPGLTIALHHAAFHARADGIYLEPIGTNDVRVNGRAASGPHRVAPGDVVGLGSFELRVLPRGGEDLALEIEEIEGRASAREELARRTRIGIERGLLSRRSLSWALFLGVLGACLAAPLLSRPLQRSWSSGPIAAPHATFQNDCGRCHESGFQRVADAQCLACHTQIGAHTQAAAHPQVLADLRCGACHLEHNGRLGLAALEQAACAGCHADLKARSAQTDFADASDFATHHPEFRLSLVTHPGGGELRRESWDSKPREASGLRFSHLRHVGQVLSDPASGEKRNQGCRECHVPDAAGLGFEPIDFATHCQACHSLTFEKGFAKREAFHGDPAHMRQGLREFYAGLALAGRVRDPAAPELVRRAIPGATLSEEQRRAALRWAEGAAQRANEFLLREPGECAVCHELVEGSTQDGGTGIAPVEVASQWLPNARFSHRAHATTACRSCHPAAAVFDAAFEPEHPRPAWSLAGAGPHELVSPEELRRVTGLEPSEDARDVLIPGIGACRECHAGASAEPPKLASDCVECHGFHREDFGPMRQAFVP